MRVAVDARLVAYQRAGIANYVTSLVGAMPEAAPDVCVTAIVSRRASGDCFEGATRTVRAWTPPHHRFEQMGLALELARLDADLYHAPDFVPPLLRRFPAVVTVHDLYFLRDPSVLTAEARRYYGQIGAAVRSAARVIAVSECTRRDLIDLVGAPSEKVDVVYESAGRDFAPVEGDRARAVAARHGLSGPYFLFVGTREPRKNLARLIDAHAALGEDAPGLAVAGARGWLDDGLEARAGGRVRLLGRVPDADLPALYGGAEALVFPSLYEGFGLPVLEAMACGTPVVASSAGSLPEIAGDAALLVDPLDVGAIAAAMRRVWREEGLGAELHGRGLERARRFSWHRAAAETADVYRRAA